MSAVVEFLIRCCALGCKRGQATPSYAGGYATTEGRAAISGGTALHLQLLVGVTGFEPATSSSRTKRATKLRHTPLQGLFAEPPLV